MDGRLRECRRLQNTGTKRGGLCGGDDAGEVDLSDLRAAEFVAEDDGLLDVPPVGPELDGEGLGDAAERQRECGEECETSHAQRIAVGASA